MILLIHSWSGANDTVKRHWPFYENAGADKIIGVGTDNGLTLFPDGVETVAIGDDAYMRGSNLCRRLMFTIDWCLNNTTETHFVISEYDTLFFKPIPKWNGVGGYLAGGSTWNSKASCFYHNPWLFDRESGCRLRDEMAAILREGHCQYGTPESSPDVFFAWACERAGVKVQQVLREYSRNDIDRQQYFDEARAGVVNGVHCVHGVKTAEQLRYITGESGMMDVLLATAFTMDYKRAEGYVQSLHNHCNVPFRALVIGRDMPDYGMPRSIVQAGHFLAHLPLARRIIFTDADIIMHRPLSKDELKMIYALKDGQIMACPNKHPDQKWGEEVVMLNQIHRVDGYEDVKVFNTGFVVATTETYRQLFDRFKALWNTFNKSFEHYAKIQICMCAAAHELGFEWVPCPYTLCSQGHFGPPPGVALMNPPLYGGQIIAFDHRITN